MTVRMMYDSTNVAAIPSSAQLIAVYEQGHYQTLWAARKRFPRAQLITIDVYPAVSSPPRGMVADVEKGDLTPAQFHEWARESANSGTIRPTAYCSLSIAQEVSSLAPPGVVTDLWVADWTGVPHRPVVPRGNVVACQYASPHHGSPGWYDLTAVYDESWHPSR